MYKKKKLNTGDVVGYTANFLRATGDDYCVASRRGVILSISDTSDLVRIKWSDEPDYEKLSVRYGDDYAQDIRENGECVNINNIAKIRSVEFRWADHFGKIYDI